MRWPWKRRRRPVVDVGPLEGARAREHAEKRLEHAMEARRATEAETPMYRSLGESLRELREANHFAQAIRESMRPR